MNIEQYIEIKITELKASLEAQQVLFTNSLKHIFDSDPSITAIEVIGYTPEWNDGDQCEHSHYLSAIYRDDKKFVNYREEESDVTFTSSDRTIQTLIERNQTLHSVFNTDFRVVINRDLTFTEEEYDCGY